MSTQAAVREEALQVSLAGYDLINSPRLNIALVIGKGGSLFDLHGLLPPHVGSLDEEVERRKHALSNQATPFNQYRFLRDLNRFYAIDRFGLVTENGKDVRPEQLPYARNESEVHGWRQSNGEITLLDVVRNVKSTVLIGVSGQGGAFTEQAVQWPACDSSPGLSTGREFAVDSVSIDCFRLAPISQAKLAVAPA